MIRSFRSSPVFGVICMFAAMNIFAPDMVFAGSHDDKVDRFAGAQASEYAPSYIIRSTMNRPFAGNNEENMALRRMIDEFRAGRDEAAEMDIDLKGPKSGYAQPQEIASSQREESEQIDIQLSDLKINNSDPQDDNPARDLPEAVKDHMIKAGKYKAVYANNKWYVLWTEYRDNYLPNIKGCVFDSDGVPLTEDYTLTSMYNDSYGIIKHNEVLPNGNVVFIFQEYKVLEWYGEPFRGMNKYLYPSDELEAFSFNASFECKLKMAIFDVEGNRIGDSIELSDDSWNTYDVFEGVLVDDENKTFALVWNENRFVEGTDTTRRYRVNISVRDYQGNEVNGHIFSDRGTVIYDALRLNNGNIAVFWGDCTGHYLYSRLKVGFLDKYGVLIKEYELADNLTSILHSVRYFDDPHIKSMGDLIDLLPDGNIQVIVPILKLQDAGYHCPVRLDSLTGYVFSDDAEVIKEVVLYDYYSEDESQERSRTIDYFQCLPNGNIVIFWRNQDKKDGTYIWQWGMDIYGPDLAKVCDEFLFHESDYPPDVALSGVSGVHIFEDNNFAVIWEVKCNRPRSCQLLYVDFYNSQGERLCQTYELTSARGKLDNDFYHHAHFERSVSLSSNRVAIFWQPTYGYDNIFCQVFSNSGDILHDPVLVHSFGSPIGMPQFKIYEVKKLDDDKLAIFWLWDDQTQPDLWTSAFRPNHLYMKAFTIDGQVEDVEEITNGNFYQILVNDITVTSDGDIEIQWREMSQSLVDNPPDVIDSDRIRRGNEGIILDNSPESVGNDLIDISSDKHQRLLDAIDRIFFSVIPSQRTFSGIKERTSGFMFFHNTEADPYDFIRPFDSDNWIAGSALNVNMQNIIYGRDRIPFQESLRASLDAYRPYRVFNAAYINGEDEMAQIISSLQDKVKLTETERALYTAAQVIQEISLYMDGETMMAVSRDMNLVLMLEELNVFGQAQDLKFIQGILSEFVINHRALYDNYLSRTTAIYDEIQRLLDIDIDGASLPDEYISLSKLVGNFRQKVVIDLALQEIQNKPSGLLSNSEEKALETAKKLIPLKRKYIKDFRQIISSCLRSIKERFTEKEPVALAEEPEGTTAFFLFEE